MNIICVCVKINPRTCGYDYMAMFSANEKARWWQRSAYEVKPNMSIDQIMRILQKNTCMCACICVLSSVCWVVESKIWMDYGRKSLSLIGFLIHIPIIKFIRMSTHTHACRIVCNIHKILVSRDIDGWFWMWMDISGIYTYPRMHSLAQ